MSEFSEKLSYYIAQSGYNVYQLAKEASIDRTTLQKTVKGQRLPSVEYVKDICKYIKISKAQEEELLQLYKTEKLGRNVIEAWAEIHHMILDISELRKRSEGNTIWNLHFDRQSVESLELEEQQVFTSQIEIMRAVMYMVEKEIIEEDEPEIYMDVSYASQYALDQLVQSDNFTEKPIVCHQLANLRRTENSKDGLVTNFQILRQVLPNAFAIRQKYDIRYTYVTESAEDRQYQLWPHYIVTHKHVFLCSEKHCHAVLLSGKKIAECYRKELEQMMCSYRPLFTYQGFSGEGVCKIRQMNEYVDSHIIYEAFPCIAMMVPEEMKQVLMQDPQFGSYAEAFFNQANIPANQIINIFGMKGMKNFIQNGKVPGIFENYVQKIDLDMRKAMCTNFYQHLKNQTRQFYMINEETFPVSDGIGIELYGKNKVSLCSTSDEILFGFIMIDESGICEAFYGYMEALLDSKYLYSTEETIVKYEEMVKEYFAEIEFITE